MEIRTRKFKTTVRARVQRDAAFRRELLREAVESFLQGEVETGKAMLRDYINATIGFQELAAVTNHSSKSLMRMLGPSGNLRPRICLRFFPRCRKGRRSSSD